MLQWKPEECLKKAADKILADRLKQWEEKCADLDKRHLEDLKKQAEALKIIEAMKITIKLLNKDTKETNIHHK